MTKRKLIEALKELKDDATIKVYGVSDGLNTYAFDVYLDDITTGDEEENEITIVAHF